MVEALTLFIFRQKTGHQLKRLVKPRNRAGPAGRPGPDVGRGSDRDQDSPLTAAFDTQDAHRHPGWPRPSHMERLSLAEPSLVPEDRGHASPARRRRVVLAISRVTSS